LQQKNISRGAAPVKPTAIHPFFDKAVFWLRQPVGAATIAKLKKQCGSLDFKNKKARFDRRYRQRIEFRQPSLSALQWLAGRRDAWVNSAEIALDYIFESAADQELAWEFFLTHLVRRWHGKKQQVRVYRQTGYDAGRWAPNRYSVYPQQHSRVTGELYCVHLEWRITVARAVRSAGIRSPAGLLTFDHRQFWERRLLLYELDKELLGRLLRNKRDGTKSRKPQWNRKLNLDLYHGHIFSSVFAKVKIGGCIIISVQKLIDEIGSDVRVHRALHRISSEPLLPPIVL
jgi:hypothetical protein